MPSYNLNAKVVIITGASSGLGAACAEAFAAEGAKIVITGRNESRLQEVAKKCQEIGLAPSKILTLVVDHSKETDNDKTVSEAVAKFGQLDVLVNNAGIAWMGPSESCTKEDYLSVMNLNARAPFRLTQVATPHLRKTKGNIVNISSIAGFRGGKQGIPYYMSKAALDNLTRSSCIELAPDGIRVNSVNPSYISTNILTRLGVPDSHMIEVEKEQGKTHPLGRNGLPHEVADAVLYLASDKASFISGVTLTVDGGRMAQIP